MISLDTRFAIEDLVTSYSYGYDQMEWDLYASIWAEDAVLASSAGEQKGREMLVSGARKWREHLQTQGIQTRHYQTNTLLTFVDKEHLQGRTMLQVAWQKHGKKEPVLVHTGIYTDEYQLIDSGWLIVRRQITIDHD